MLQVGSGGGGSKLETFSTFDIKTDEDELAGEEVVISFQDPSYIIASVKFSNIRSADGLYHTPSVTVQSIGTYTFNCGTAKEINKTISSFDMITPIEITMEILRDMYIFKAGSGALVPLTPIVALANLDLTRKDHIVSTGVQEQNSFACGVTNLIDLSEFKKIQATFSCVNTHTTNTEYHFTVGATDKADASLQSIYGYLTGYYYHALSNLTNYTATVDISALKGSHRIGFGGASNFTITEIVLKKE